MCVLQGERSPCDRRLRRRPACCNAVYFVGLVLPKFLRFSFRRCVFDAIGHLFITTFQVVLASVPDLECGYSRSLFVDWCDNPKNSVVLTCRSSEGTLARSFIDNIQQKEVTLKVWPQFLSLFSFSFQWVACRTAHLQVQGCWVFGWCKKKIEIIFYDMRFLASYWSKFKEWHKIWLETLGDFSFTLWSYTVRHFCDLFFVKRLSFQSKMKIKQIRGIFSSSEFLFFYR